MERLLTPEELERKTAAIAGYVWGRSLSQDVEVGRRSYLNAPRADGARYELMYGGIDSDGITVRAGDVTPLMAAVAQRHAIEVSCPIVLRDLFLLSDEKPLPFRRDRPIGVTAFRSPRRLCDRGPPHGRNEKRIL